MNDSSTLTINVASVESVSDLHELFAQELHFPGYYGRNWDAFWDCISTSSQSIMPETLIIQGIESLIACFPIDAEIMRKCFDDYLVEHPDKKVYFSKRACPCCGYMTLNDHFPGSYEICPICFWEDDFVQFENPDNEGGANKISLRVAQRNFLEFGACEPEAINHVRQPTEVDIKDPRWKTEGN